MPRLIELTAFDVPECVTPERSPSKIVPCPLCRRFHVAPRDARLVHLSCTTSPRYVAELVDAGDAPRRLADAFTSGNALPEDSDLWRLQPRELYEKHSYITHGQATYLNAIDL